MKSVNVREFKNNPSEALPETGNDPVVVLKEGQPEVSAGARAMLGFARRFRSRPQRTSEWMKRLREGEER